MSIEKDLSRIADALEDISLMMAGGIVSDEPEMLDPPEQPKPSKKKRSKKQASKQPAAEAPSPENSYPVPTNEVELIALMTEHTKGLVPEKMIELGRIMREDFKVSKLPDLPEDDYADFAAALYTLVNS